MAGARAARAELPATRGGKKKKKKVEEEAAQHCPRPLSPSFIQIAHSAGGGILTDTAPAAAGRRPPLSSTQPQRTCCAQFLLLSADHSIIYSSVRHDAASSFQLLHPRPPMCRLLSALLSSASFLPHAHALNLLNTLAHMKEQFGRYWFWIASGR